MFYFSIGIWLLLALLVVVTLARCFRLVPNRRAYIVERLGRYHQSWNAGFHMLLPFFDRVAYQQDLREETIDVPPQDCFTKDNVKVEVDGVLYLSVMNPVNASYGVTNYKWAAIQLAQTTTRSVIGTLELDRTFEERDAVSSRVVSVLNEVSETWGIQVHRYEVKNIVVPGSVRNSMERQMAAERDRRALLARSEGERQARINASEASRTEAINRSEGEMQRRVNTAQGRAQEILAVAHATAESIRKMGLVLSQPGGLEAVSLRLGESYINGLAALASADTRVLLPADLSNLDQVLSGLGLTLPVGGEVAPGPALGPGQPSPRPVPQAALRAEPSTLPGMPALDREPR